MLVSDAGILAEVIRRKRPVVFNDYANNSDSRGLLEGNTELKRLILVPVIENEQVVMLTGVGNKPSDYVEQDMETVQLIANEIWRIVQNRRYLSAVKESEQRFNTFMETIPGIAWIKDAQGRHLYMNEYACKVFGIGQEQAPGTTIFDLLSHEVAERCWASDQAVIESGKSSEFIEVFPDQDGHTRDWQIFKFPFEGATGQWLLGSIGLDITERKQMELELQKLSLAVEQSPESVVITDLDANMEFVNETFLQSTGYSRDEVIGQNPRMLQSGKTPNTTYMELWDALNQGLSWKGELNNRRKDGSEYIELAHISPIRQADGQISHYLATKEDITEKVQLAEELDSHRHHLEDLVKQRTAELVEARDRAEAATQAKSAFLANMSHEIRTPMNAIIGLTHLLRRAGATPKQLLQLNKIDSTGQHLLSIINDILDISKIEAGRLQLESTDFHISAIIDNISLTD